MIRNLFHQFILVYIHWNAFELLQCMINKKISYDTYLTLKRSRAIRKCNISCIDRCMSSYLMHLNSLEHISLFCIKTIKCNYFTFTTITNHITTSGCTYHYLCACVRGNQSTRSKATCLAWWPHDQLTCRPRVSNTENTCARRLRCHSMGQLGGSRVSNWYMQFLINDIWRLTKICLQVFFNILKSLNYM